MNTQRRVRLACPQCAAGLDPEVGERFLVCPYCDSSLYLDRGRMVHHWKMQHTLDEQQAFAVIGRWMEDDRMPLNLDQRSKIELESFQYYPIWLVRITKDGQERLLIEPGTEDIIPSLMINFQLPAGVLKNFDRQDQAPYTKPTIALNTVLDWLGMAGVIQDQILELALMQVPIYFFHYEFEGQRYTALLEAATGMIYADNFPSTDSHPIVSIGPMSILIFAAFALMPYIGLRSDGIAGYGVGSLLYWIFVGLSALILSSLATEAAEKKLISRDL